MTRRYLVALVDGGGNVPPELAAVRRLVDRGHMVTVLAEDSVADEVRATGASLRRWERAPNRPDRRPEHDPARDWECRYPWQLVERLTKALFVGPAAASAADVGAAIGDARPDLVICSMFCLGGMVAAEGSDIPFDVLLPNIYLLPAPGLPPFGLGQHRLPPLPHFFDQVRLAHRQLVLTSAEFDFPAAFPAPVRYVGPVLDDPQWAEVAPWTPPAGSAPLVLVAMSSTFQDQIACLQRVVDALGTLPVRGVVTTGPAIDPVSLEPMANVTVLRSAPHRHVLLHASLVVTHGGHGTVMKALAAGVPMVILPHGRDQADTAARVTARRAGVVLTRTATSGAIATAIQRVLRNDSYRAAAQRLGDAVRRDAKSDELIRELEQVPGAEIGDASNRHRRRSA